MSRTTKSMTPSDLEAGIHLFLKALAEARVREGMTVSEARYCLSKRYTAEQFNTIVAAAEGAGFITTRTVANRHRPRCELVLLPAFTAVQRQYDATAQAQQATVSSLAARIQGKYAP